MTIFWPSTHPSSRSPCRNASSRYGLSEGDVALRKPIRGAFPACWALAARGSEEADYEAPEECAPSDRLVGPPQQRRRVRQAEGLGSVEIDAQSPSTRV